MISCSKTDQRFEKIGVVEGFYGTPWTHEARLDMVSFMGEVGMDTYFYAPKDDPYHRAKWREPYAGEKLEEFSELISVSKQSGVDVFFAISPGLDIVYSDSADFAALNNKLQAMVGLGVEHFALFLDDVPEDLRHAADKEQYENLAAAHADLINRLWDKLKEQNIEFVVCPTTYTSAWGNRDYIQELGETIPQEISLFWTGEDVAIAKITEAETRDWKRLIQRKPLIWDNFPVNDFEGWRPILGPLRGRSPNLPKVAEGIIANPMDRPYSSMIPLYTVADYGKDPAGYEPDTALHEAVTSLAGEKALAHIMPVVKTYSDYGWTDNEFTPVYTPGKQLDADRLYETLDSLQYHLEQLKAPMFSGNDYVQHFVAEIEPFISKTRADLDELLKTDRSLPDITSGYEKKWENARFSIRQEGDKWTATLDVDEGHSKNEWVMIVTQYKTPPEVWLQPEDLIIRWDLANSDTARGDHFYLTPFSRKGISDIKVRTITSFFEHFTRPSNTEITTHKEDHKDHTSYVVTFPAPEQDSVRFNVFVNPGYMLSKQPYLGNPFTYPVLVRG
ncbi:protein O-GlcNAcase [Gracilimonas sp.]|uniref:protein O-GlcNAcase n=1 Tax=Gracilimonas sp. TaxID=1974203 RepID=UPI0032ECC2AD